MWRTPPIEWSDKFSTTSVSIVNHEWVFKNLFFIFDPLIFISSPTCSFFPIKQHLLLIPSWTQSTVGPFPRDWFSLMADQKFTLKTLITSQFTSKHSQYESYTLMIQKSHTLITKATQATLYGMGKVKCPSRNHTSTVARLKIHKKRALRVITGWGWNRKQLPLTGDNSFNQVSRSTRR